MEQQFLAVGVEGIHTVPQEGLVLELTLLLEQQLVQAAPTYYL